MSEARQHWDIIFTRQAEVALCRLSKPALRQIDRAILALAEDPRPLESLTLIGDDNVYRLPVDEWRITYAVDEKRLTILILEIGSKQRPDRYRLAEEREQTQWLEEIVNSEQDPGVKIEELFRANLLYHAFKAFRDRAEFLKFVQDFDRLEKASALLLSPKARERLRKLKEDLEKTLAKLMEKQYERQTGQGKIRLLIVDDLAETRENIRQLLFFEPDIEVVGSATHGEEAIQMVTERRPDIVLMDLLLPGLDGITATERILQQMPSTKVIMMSVLGEADVFRRAMMAGAREFLVKPFSADELVSSIRRVFQPKQTLLTVQSLFPQVFKPMMQDEFLEYVKFLKGKKEADSGHLPAERFKLNKLGDYLEISLSVADLSESLSFYKKIGLKKVDGDDRPYPWAIVSDDTLHLGLHQCSFSSPTLNYFGDSHSPTPYVLDTLLKLNVPLAHMQKINEKTDMHNGEVLKKEFMIAADFETIEGQRVFLADKNSEVEPNLKRKFFSKNDKFGELSLKTKDVNAAVAYWKQLGFKQVSQNNKPYPLAVVSDGLIRIGLHQTCKFTRPAITYFTPDMPQRLKRLHKQGLEFKSEQKDSKGQLVGAMVESPDGQPFFLFTGEVKG
jgi:DNA-binding NarL/FixJ family response regulator/mRNA-degrading endonuclease RelE of RelBE toxin-antitoxin system/catechol 2,3-dioxygenase-like lactoylglutathione lyase family enzyme